MILPEHVCCFVHYRLQESLRRNVLQTASILTSAISSGGITTVRFSHTFLFAKRNQAVIEIEHEYNKLPWTGVMCVYVESPCVCVCVCV